MKFNTASISFNSIDGSLDNLWKCGSTKKVFQLFSMCYNFVLSCTTHICIYTFSSFVMTAVQFWVCFSFFF